MVKFTNDVAAFPDGLQVCVTELLDGMYFDTKNNISPIFKKYVEKFKERCVNGEVLEGLLIGGGHSDKRKYPSLPTPVPIVTDISIGGVYLPYPQVIAFCQERHLRMPPRIVSRGLYSQENLREWLESSSLLSPSEKLKGIVVRPLYPVSPFVCLKVKK